MQVDGGTITAPLTLRLPRDGFRWDGARMELGDTITRAGLALLGGGGMITDLEIHGGGCLGQLTIGLDQGRRNQTGSPNIPQRLTVDGYRIDGHTGDGGSFEWLHALYLNCSTFVDQQIILRHGHLGPVPGGGPVMKLGGDGGARGILVEEHLIEVGKTLARDGQLPRSLVIANATNVVIRAMSVDYPSIIDIQGGSRVRFEDCSFPPGTKVLFKELGASITLFGRRLSLPPKKPRWLAVGQNAPGLTWG